jgi:hypothetical protein
LIAVFIGALVITITLFVEIGAPNKYELIGVLGYQFINTIMEVVLELAILTFIRFNQAREEKNSRLCYKISGFFFQSHSSKNSVDAKNSSDQKALSISVSGRKEKSKTEEKSEAHQLTDSNKESSQSEMVELP